MERAARAEKNHKKTKKGIGARFAGWVGMVTDWRRVKEIGAWMSEGAGIALDPRRYPWSERERWMNPPETRVSFEQAMAREGATEADVARKLGVPQSYVSKCESGTRRMDVTEVHAWLDAVDRDWVTFMLTLGHALDAQGLQTFPPSRF